MELEAAIALKAALQAGEIITEMRKSGFSLKHKGDRDLLTSADLAAEKAIISIIKDAFPQHTILSEEASPDATREKLRHDSVWIIDPIDGTTNYAHGHHQVGISIAYAERGVVQVGVVHAPFLSETFTAIRGKGAFLNQTQIDAGNKTELVNSLIATGFPYDRSETHILSQRIDRILRSCRDIRRLGAASLDICWVACDRLDAYYESVCIWDMAAGSLIAQEAGATVTHISEVPDEWKEISTLYPTELLVCKPGIATQLKSVLSS